jgi:hypothetical protein
MYLVGYVFCDISLALLCIIFMICVKSVHNWRVVSVGLYPCLLCPELLVLNGLDESRFLGSTVQVVM